MNLTATRVMTIVRSRDSLTVRLLHGVRGLEAIRPAWEELAQHVDPAAFHHQYAWYESYVRHLDDDPRSMLFVWVSRGAKTVAILPLKYRKAKRIGGARVLQLPSHDHFCVADALVRSGENHAAVMDRVIEQLRLSDAPEWDELLFSQVPADSAVDRGLRSRRRMTMVREMDRESDFIPNAGGYAATVQRLSGSFRRDLRRKLKHAESQGQLSYRSIESQDGLEAAFTDFLEVEGSGWKGWHGTRTAINCNPDLEAFYRALMRLHTPDSHCVINLLYLDDICIAAEFCLYCRGVLSLLKIGYTEAHARVSPGSLLLDRVLRDWCERPGVRAVSLVGDAAWQKSWHPAEEPVFRYRVYNRTVRALSMWLWRVSRPFLLRSRGRVLGFFYGRISSLGGQHGPD